MIIYRCDICGSETTDRAALGKASPLPAVFNTKFLTEKQGEAVLSVSVGIEGKGGAFVDHLCLRCLLDVMEKVLREYR